MAESQDAPKAASAQKGADRHASGAHAAKKAKGTPFGKVFLVAFAGALAACAVAIGASLGLGLFSSARPSAVLGSAGFAPMQEQESDATLAETVAGECLSSVVLIQSYAESSNSAGSSVFDLFYGQPEGDGSLKRISVGSGVVLSDDGYIVTNSHVVSTGTEVKISSGGKTYDADVIGKDPDIDLAVLKARDASGFKPIAIGDSDNVRIGEWVMAVGSPFGLEHSVATGIVSAIGRSQTIVSSSSSKQGGSGEIAYPDMIQTDASVNPGSSGGALVDAGGQLIGINTLVTSTTGSYAGVGFAIPSNYAISVAQSFIAGAEPAHPRIGANLATVSEQSASIYGFGPEEGAYVFGVAKGSPAASAGIKVGDIIVGFDGEEVSSASDLMLDLLTKHPGDEVTLTIYRDSEKQDVKVRLGEAGSDDEQSDEEGGVSSSGIKPFSL